MHWYLLGGILGALLLTIPVIRSRSDDSESAVELKVLGIKSLGLLGLFAVLIGLISEQLQAQPSAAFLILLVVFAGGVALPLYRVAREMLEAAEVFGYLGQQAEAPGGEITIEGGLADKNGFIRMVMEAFNGKQSKGEPGDLRGQLEKGIVELQDTKLRVARFAPFAFMIGATVTLMVSIATGIRSSTALESLLPYALFTSAQCAGFSLLGLFLNLEGKVHKNVLVGKMRPMIEAFFDLRKAADEDKVSSAVEGLEKLDKSLDKLDKGVSSAAERLEGFGKSLETGQQATSAQLTSLGEHLDQMSKTFLALIMTFSGDFKTMTRDFLSNMTTMSNSIKSQSSEIVRLKEVISHVAGLESSIKAQNQKILEMFEGAVDGIFKHETLVNHLLLLERLLKKSFESENTKTGEMCASILEVNKRILAVLSSARRSSRDEDSLSELKDHMAELQFAIGALAANRKTETERNQKILDLVERIARRELPDDSFTGNIVRFGGTTAAGRAPRAPGGDDVYEVVPGRDGAYTLFPGGPRAHRADVRETGRRENDGDGFFARIMRMLRGRSTQDDA